MADKRSDPDALLDNLLRNGRGRLTVFLGAAAGVGKTYAMLEAARERLHEGIDVAVGWVETHGRKETEEMVKGLQVIEPHFIEYRGKSFAEMNLDAILARHPQIILVDELAHSNIPGSRHNKRFQDVEEILEAGIDVYTTINIQHLASLNDIVARITEVTIRETVPDKILEMAEIKLVDIPTEELIQRLHEGKVYVPDQVAEAIRKFFRPGNINALREMTLRYTAKLVDREMENYMRAHAIEGPWPAGEKVMVCVSSSPFALQLIRQGHRLASYMKATWFVVYVDSTGSIPETGREKDRLFASIRLAEELGAESEIISGTDIASELLYIARQRNATQIIIGKPLRSRFQELLRGSVVDQVIRHSEGTNVHVIAGQPNNYKTSPEASHPAPQSVHTYVPYLQAIALVVLITVLLIPFINALGLVNIAMIYLLPVLFSAVYWSRQVAMATALISIMTFDFFFIPPQISFTVQDLRYLLSFAIMVVVAYVTGSMSQRLRQQVDYAHQREQMMAALYSLSRDIGGSSELGEVLEAVVKKVSETTAADSVILLPDHNNLLLVHASTGSINDSNLPESERAVATWAWQHVQVAGHGTDTLGGADLIYIPMRTKQELIGVLGVEPLASDLNFWTNKKPSIEAFTNLAAVAINRMQLAEKAREAQLNAESERLRTALFNSLSHDLRTPLTSIIGSVTGLMEEEELYDAYSRQALLDNIRQGALRMHRLVNNLLDMARVHSGFLQLNKEWYDVQDMIGVAVSRMDYWNNASYKIDIDDNIPLVEVDFMLIEQVLLNIIENALKYDGTEGEIIIRAYLQGPSIEFAISDQGPGIPSEDLEKVFDPFFRLQNTRHISGTGLGLAICKSIVEAHGGRIWAENNLGAGATIHFSLPLGETCPGHILPDIVGVNDGT